MALSLVIPAGVGNANNGSNLGVSDLNTNNVASNTNTNYGGALTSKLGAANKNIIKEQGKLPR